MLRQLFGYLGSDMAVDLGTANTLIGVAGEGLILDEPSIVAVAQETQRVLSGGCAVGHLAKQMLGRTPDSIAVVRPLQHGVVTDFSLCEAMLGYLLRKARPPGRWGRPRLLVTVPGSLTPVERRAVVGSAHRAGARRVLLIREAMAAAVGAGLPVVEPVASMVCDIGGGTTEVAVTSLANVVAGRSVRVAGDAMDRAVVDYLRRNYSLEIGLPAAERLKIEIGSAHPLPQERVEEVRGIDCISRMPRKATVTSEEIREALGDPLESIVEAIQAALDRLDPELAADLMDRGMVLCGGGARLRRIERFLHERTGLPARLADQPQTVAVRGALVCLEHLDQWQSALESSDDDL